MARTRCAVQSEPRFPTDRLRAEVEDPFGKVRILIYGFLCASASLSLLVSLPKLLGTALDAPGAAPLDTVSQNLAVNAGGVVLFGFLASYELDMESKREQQKQEGSLLAQLKVRLLREDLSADAAAVRLRDFRSSASSAGDRALRPVICLGGLDFCRQCVETSLPFGKAIDGADLLLVPAPLGKEGTLNGAVQELRELTLGLAHVALPDFNSGGWSELGTLEVEQVKRQGMDESQGLVLIIKKNGRIGTRFLGLPDWAGITGQVGARTAAGMDTTNI